ncbi:MAG: hypothetical protein M3Y72_02915, partial [Acidobacteriota bacterium]|nr:hypothetical protein [Acidobacteriota bacterium]
MNPTYPIPVTVAIPTPGLTFSTLPPEPKTSGMMTENPAPTSANPGIVQPGDVMHNAHSKPNAPRILPLLTAARGPSFDVIQSPRNRKIAMAAENTEYPAAAVPGPAFKACRKYTAVQSAIAPSESNIQNPMALN